MTIFHNLLVGLSGTDVDGDLIRYAGNVARLLKPAKIDYVHVLSSDAPTRETIIEGLDKHPGELLNEIRVTTNTPRGRPLNELIKFALTHKTDLILAGRRKGRDGRRSLASKLAMNAPCSVWMIPQAAPPSFDRILAPVEFSAPSRAALSIAAEFAIIAEASHLHPLHVYFNDTIVTDEERDQAIRKEKEEGFERFMASIDLRYFQKQLIFDEGPNVARAIKASPPSWEPI